MLLKLLLKDSLYMPFGFGLTAGKKNSHLTSHTMLHRKGWHPAIFQQAEKTASIVTHPSARP